MNMLCRETHAAQPANLFDDMAHLQARQANPPATCTTKPRGPLYRQGDMIGPVTLSGALR